MQRKIIIAVAPVAHTEKQIPPGITNPAAPEEIARETVDCARAGAALVHLHVRDRNGRQTGDLTEFSRTLTLIRKSTDIIIQGSTGGMAALSPEERSVSITEPRVESASLNMGSVNFGESVYINTIPDITFWAEKMRTNTVVPELEIFDLSMLETARSMSRQGILPECAHINFSLGFKGALSATPINLCALVHALPQDTSWSLLHEGMEDFSLLGAAIGLGAGGIRVGYEDGFFIKSGYPAKNAELVAHAALLARCMGYEIATPEEARRMLHIKASV